MFLEQSIILLQIIFIDIVMAADNAIIIGMIAANFAPDNRKKIIAFGVAAAFIFRVVFALSATFLLAFSWIKILGGILLLWVIYNLRKDLFESKKVRSPNLKSKESTSFSTGVYQVLIADITLSLDNVLGVAGAAKQHYWLLVTGLLLSVVLIGTLASYFAKYIKQHRWLGWLGIGVIFIVALQLIIGGLDSLNMIEIKEPFRSLFHV
ncbi:YjbE family putative metal transport protein [Pelagibacteraceae bacterium]|jgi:YjbE family integral membrane protein|nr:YjbE family putative metal transport protein [Pelagibacteraceae bacterium]